MSPTWLDMTNDFMILFGEHVERIALEKQAELEKEAWVPLVTGAVAGIGRILGGKGIRAGLKKLPRMLGKRSGRTALTSAAKTGIKKELASTAVMAPVNKAVSGIGSAVGQAASGLTAMPSTNVKVAGIGSAFLKGVKGVGLGAARGATRFTFKNPGKAFTLGVGAVGAGSALKSGVDAGRNLARTAGQTTVSGMSTPSTGI